MNIGLPIYQPPTKIKIKRKQNGKIHALFEFKDRRKYLHHPEFIFETPIGKGENMEKAIISLLSPGTINPHFIMENGHELSRIDDSKSSPEVQNCITKIKNLIRAVLDFTEKS